MGKRGKKYRASLQQVDPAKSYPLDEALSVLAKFEKRTFDETVELALGLRIDPKKADQLVRGTFSFPRGLGKQVRVIVFAQGEEAEAARAAGAVEAGADELVKKVQEGWLDFDVAIAHPSMMGKVGKLGRVLGPQGKMPSPKAGTVSEKTSDAVRAFRAGKIEYRNDDAGNLHVPVGKRSFPVEHLKENIQALLEHVRGTRPASVKGTFFKRVVLSGTMTPGIALAVAE
jgi:large subunit ribosomal protein L1